MTKKEMEQKLLIKPKELQVQNGMYTANKDACICTNVSIDISYLLQLAGFQSRVKKTEAPNGLYVLSVGKEKVSDRSYIFANDEAFYLTVGTDTLEIVGKTIDGMLLGLKTFIRISEELDILPQFSMMDYPDIGFRSVHTCIFSPKDCGIRGQESTTPEDIKKMMRTAALSGYNHIFVEFWGMFPYSMDYAHWPEAYSKKEVEDLVSYALDKLYIRPLPAQNLTGHAAWSRISSRKHVFLDQRPDLEDMFIPGGWCFATEKPEVQQLLMKVMDELLEVFRNPPYFHACCDKTFGFGSTETDRMFSADILFAKHITFLSSYLAQKNTRMIMWSDMLYSSMDALYWKCDPKTVEYLPKNIVMNVWTHENPGDDWKDPEFFEEKGFPTIYAPWMNEKGIESMVNLCRKRGSMGMIQTTWHKPQTASYYVILSGAMQWCGTVPDCSLVEQHKNRWYQSSLTV